MTRAFSKRELIGVGVAALILIVLLPCLNAVTAPGSWLHINDFTINHYGKALC